MQNNGKHLACKVQRAVTGGRTTPTAPVSRHLSAGWQNEAALGGTNSMIRPSDNSKQRDAFQTMLSQELQVCLPRLNSDVYRPRLVSFSARV